jgi:hypothetical protein
MTTIILVRVMPFPPSSPCRFDGVLPLSYETVPSGRLEASLARRACAEPQTAAADGRLAGTLLLLRLVGNQPIAFSRELHPWPMRGTIETRHLAAACGLTCQAREAWGGPLMAALAPGDGRVRKSEVFVADRLRALCFACTRPFGYLAFVVALAALSASARLLGDEHELGFFAGRLNEMISRYPEVTRRGVQIAWLAWGVSIGLALSPVDPIASRWDEVLLGALALGVLWRRTVGARRVGR